MKPRSAPESEEELREQKGREKAEEHPPLPPQTYGFPHFDLLQC